MKLFTRILVPLDGSPESNVALPLARTMARATGATIAMLRVLSPDAGSGVGEIRKALDRAAAELAGGGVQADVVLRLGDPAEEILAQASLTGADLVIMRTHGRGGLERMVMGSTTEKVLAGSVIPVMLVRPGGRQPRQIKTLLVPIDGSPGGALALASAVGLARATGAAIKLFETVVPVAMNEWVGYGGLAYYDPAWDDEALASANTYVTSLVARLQEAGLQASGEARESREVAGAIVKAADESGADLILMSTHALTGVARAVLGSVADCVVRKANCPVLLVHRVESGSAGSEPNQTAGERLAV